MKQLKLRSRKCVGLYTTFVGNFWMEAAGSPVGKTIKKLYLRICDDDTFIYFLTLSIVLFFNLKTTFRIVNHVSVVT
jgi:hypothetical protein